MVRVGSNGRSPSPGRFRAVPGSGSADPSTPRDPSPRPATAARPVRSVPLALPAPSRGKADNGASPGLSPGTAAVTGSGGPRPGAGIPSPCAPAASVSWSEEDRADRLAAAYPRLRLRRKGGWAVPAPNGLARDGSGPLSAEEVARAAKRADWVLAQVNAR
ncbi:hypothetical protein ZWY2020_020049 [Hordeum vulgare]|nr:hypothetical protein ZWY2020_020049 [Hordeum vulgare]